jgi:hypothetical protein
MQRSWWLGPEVVAARADDDHASLTFQGGAVLTVERAKKRHGRSTTWVAMLDEPGHVLRAAQCRSREAAAVEAVRIWEGWRRMR